MDGMGFRGSSIPSMCQSLHEGRSITRTVPLLLTYSWLQIISKVPGVSPVSNQIFQVPKMEVYSPIHPISCMDKAYLRGKPTPKMAKKKGSVYLHFLGYLKLLVTGVGGPGVFKGTNVDGRIFSSMGYTAEMYQIPTRWDNGRIP